jgi:hypothetical protein
MADFGLASDGKHPVTSYFGVFHGATVEFAYAEGMQFCNTGFPRWVSHDRSTTRCEVTGNASCDSPAN